MRHFISTIVFIFLFSVFAACSPGNSPKQQAITSDDTQYLLFQFFTYNPSSNGFTQPLDSNAIKNQMEEILTALGNVRGDGNSRQLGFAIGPLSLDHTDEQLRAFIQQSFIVAEAKNVAVAFHIDDSMFWINRPYLWRDPKNIEWSDWNGTVLPHRYISWAPVVLAPQMCYNSPSVRKEIQRIAREVIGLEIKKGIDFLTSKNKAQLFAGVIAGWETHLADYRYLERTDSTALQLGIPRVRIGYNALTNLGFSASNPPANIDSVLERVVFDFADFWAGQLAAANIPQNRIYTHISFPVLPAQQEQAMLNQLSMNLGFSANLLGFTHTAPKTAFNAHSRPGFSTYPIGFMENGVDGQLAKILNELPKQGNPHWASSEGTNLQVGTSTSNVSWNDYLAGMFKNGASVVNIFAWSNPSVYGASTKSSEAIAAYKKFLSGEL